MNSRFCRWLIVSALLITVSCRRAQPSAPASDQKEQRVNLCSSPPAFDQKSIAAFEQQAASGDAAAQCGLGFLYFNGQGVPQDYTRGVAWWRKAAEQGDAFAQANLGIAYDYGQGVPEDHTQAVFWYRKAVEQGVAAAQSAMGATYALGHGVPQDYAQAALWFRKAAEQGSTLGQYSLGNLYFNGQGVSQDYAEAYFWYDVAVAGKLHALDALDAEQVAKLREDAAKFRDETASHLTPADLSREQERARKWFEAHPAKP